MYKKLEYINFTELINKVLLLETLNRQIDEKKLSSISLVNNELVHEFIATNNIEGDTIPFSKAKEFLRNDGLVTKTELEKRWMGIKYADNIIRDQKYTLNLEYLKEAHRALMRNVDLAGGIWKTKLNQVGSLITTHPDDVANEMSNLLTWYLTDKVTAGSSVFNIIPFISEFLAIHPFEDGNGRMSRLLMNRELYDAGYYFVKYISVTKFLWLNKDNYIAALESRNKVWASKQLAPKDLLPLFNVILDALIEAANQAIGFQNLKKYTYETFQELLLPLLRSQPMSIKEIIKWLKPSNSKSTINKWLKALVDAKLIKLIGERKQSKYLC